MAPLIASPNAVLRARGFARLAGVTAIEAWMCWAGWQLHIGCDSCIALGPDSSCWGRAGCHSYRRCCGCVHCAERQAQELAEQESRAA
jgi:hypothetical protein